VLSGQVTVVKGEKSIELLDKSVADELVAGNAQ